MSGCKCGSSCKCGDNCTCESMYPEVEKATSVTVLVEGVAPVKKKYADGSEPQSVGTEGGNACKCGSNCQCDPCNC